MTTILFGAGASNGFFSENLNTSKLTAIVKDVNVWQDALLKYYKKGLPTACEIANLIHLICCANPQYHFEQICEVLDKFCSYQFDSMPQNTYFANTLFVMANKYGVGHIPAYSNWSDVPFLFRQIIADAIVNMHNTNANPNYGALIGQQIDFLNYVSNQEERMSVVSLNYDDLVYTSAIQAGLESGFVLSGDPRDKGQKVTDVQRFFNAPKVVYFPHGHIRFRFTDSGHVLFYDDYNQANVERWRAQDTFNDAFTLTGQYSQFAHNYNTFLTTGQTKDNSFNIAPYSYYYQRLASDFLNSNRIILIGYSFGDEHFNRLLHSFVNLSKNNKVYIVDYYDVHTNPITLVHEMQDQRNILMKINQTFKAPWIVNYNPATQIQSPVNMQAVADINNDAIGYGEIFPNIYYYRKGYGDFLSDYANII